MSSADYDDKPVRYVPQPDRTTRPFGTFFHPTRAVLVPVQNADGGADLQRVQSSRWSSRASRKSRYTQGTVPLSHSPPARPTSGEREKSKQDGEPGKPRQSSTPGGGQTLSRDITLTNQRLKHPHSHLKPHLRWDVSFWVAVMFVLGSAAWICNGHLLYTPLSPTPSPMHSTAAAWLAFVGGSLFEVGAYLGYVEALNAGQEEMFRELRWAVAAQKRETADGSGHESLEELVEKRKDREDDKDKFKWIGLGSPHDIGYLAAAIQLFAATIFWVSTVTGLPNVIPSLTTAWPPSAITIIFFWTPQVIGGIGFIISSLLLTLEEQKKWWRIELRRIGWHVGFWNLVGAVGFTLCGALGYASTASTKVNYQSVLATFWGSWAFMIGSVAQLWEVIWREPGDASKDANKRGEKDTQPSADE